MNDDYISREAARDAFIDSAAKNNWTNTRDYGKALDAIPAADVRPVVRCRECKRWNTDNITGSFPDGVKCYCVELSGGLKNRFTAPDDFCCWGERKEAEPK